MSYTEYLAIKTKYDNAFELAVYEFGYTPISTFWNDFSIAERFGKDAVLDTYKRASAEWNPYYKMYTELVMVLNHKMLYYYRKGNNAFYELYRKLWEEADQWGCDNLKGDEILYFYNTLD